MNLTPLQSASLAKDVYALTEYGKLDEAYLFLSAKYKDSLVNV